MPRVILASGIRGLSGHEYPGSPGRYSFKKGKTWLHKNTPPTWRNSPAQQRVNLANKMSTQAFTSITNEQRDTWKVFAKTIRKQHLWITQNYTDREAFIRTNILRLLNDDPIATTAPLIPAKNYFTALTSVVYLRPQPSLMVTFSHDYPDLDTSFFLIRASTSFPSAQRKAQKRDYRFAGDVQHFSFAPVQPSPQTVFLPLTPLTHNDQEYIYIRIQVLTSDYSPGKTYTLSTQLNSLDYLYYYDSGTYIIYNSNTSELHFYVNFAHAATLYHNGNLYLAGEVIEHNPTASTLCRDSIYYAPLASELRFATKTRAEPAWRCCFALDASGNLLVYGEIHEFSEPSSEPEPLLFHPYRNPSYLSLSADKEFAAMRFNIEPTPQNTLLLREVYEHAL